VPLACALAVLIPVTNGLAPLPELAVLAVAGIAVYVATVAVFARTIIQPIWEALRHREAAQPTAS
jgi:hypothetical protein